MVNSLMLRPAGAQSPCLGGLCQEPLAPQARYLQHPLGKPKLGFTPRMKVGVNICCDYILLKNQIPGMRFRT